MMRLNRKTLCRIYLALIIAFMLAPIVALAGVPRSYSAKAAFAKLQACPATAKNTVSCKGFVIDHKEALDCGGLDAPENMQWLTKEAGLAKDKTERDGENCQHRTHGKG